MSLQKPSLIFLVIFGMVFVPIGASGQSSSTALTTFHHDGFVSFNVDYPSDWDLDQNLITKTGWIVTFYDNLMYKIS